MGCKSVLLSAASAAIAETATYPLDFLKTRLQLDTSRIPQGLATKVASVIRREGALAMYAGISPAILRHLAYTPVRITIFESLSNWDKRQRPGDGPPALPSLLAFGLISGGLGQLVAVPADLVKVRLQADGAAVVSRVRGAPRYGGIGDAFRIILREEGVRGLWRGSLPAVQRSALVNLGELSTYSSAKHAILRSGITGGDNLYTHVGSSMCSGLVAALCSTPADVVKSRLMAEEGRARSGAVDCLRKIVAEEGVAALYKGFFPAWARLAPWQLVFWVSFEQLRKLQGLAGF